MKKLHLPAHAARTKRDKQKPEGRDHLSADRTSIYLPLLDIGELTGMDVTWYSRQKFFLRMPLSDMEAYAMNL